MDKRELEKRIRNEQNSICFTGHRFIPLSETDFIRRQLHDIIRYCWDQGFCWFICGGALGFDTLAAEEVIRFRTDEEQDAGLLLAIPCEDQTLKWSARDRNRYEYIRNNADEEIVLSSRYYEGCMHIRNQFMVTHSSLCVCYLKYFTGGTGYTVRYALRTGCKVINLFEATAVKPAELKEKPWNYIYTYPSAPENVHIALSIPFQDVRARKCHYICRRYCRRLKSGKRK